MSNMERTTSWQQIQLGVKEAERLIVRKEYNLVMVKARQVLEYMVRCMAERACVVEGDLSDTIDQLYEGQWINKAPRIITIPSASWATRRSMKGTMLPMMPIRHTSC